MSEDKKSGASWSKIIIGVTIFVLFMLWTDQRNKNERAQQEFAMQTARAENQKAIAIAATQEIEDKISDCIRVNDASRYSGSYQCVVGFLAYFQESTEPKSDASEPDFYFTYFDFMPETFYLYGTVFLGGYIGDCVKVWGEIGVDNAGTPVLSVNEDRYGEVNIERLPDDACHP